jgi:hypothetical protein
MTPSAAGRVQSAGQEAGSAAGRSSRGDVREQGDPAEEDDPLIQFPMWLSWHIK